MLKAIKLMSILLAANMEAVILVFVAWWAGKKLDESFPLDGLSWMPISFVVSIVLISYSWFLLLRPMFKELANPTTKNTD